MQFAVVSWNSLAVNDRNPFESIIPLGQLVNLSSNEVTVPRAKMFPFLSGSVLNTHTMVLLVKISETKDIPANRELLKSYFNVMDEVPHNLIANDLTDVISPGVYRQWYLTGIVKRFVEIKAGLYNVTIALEMPIWRRVVPGSTTWNITASGQTQSVTALGNIDSPPKFSITPTTTKAAGLQKGVWIPIYNPTDTIFTAPLEITGGGWNTSALVSGGKMQASGNDLRVWLDGIEVDRWQSGINTSTTLVWINWASLPGKSASILGAIAGSGAVTTISFTRTRASLAFLQSMATALNKIILLGTEAFLFTGVNLITYQLTGVTRAVKGTSMAAHLSLDTAHWIEHDLWILYKDAALGAPDVDDSLKPMCNLSSTNALLSFTNYFDEDGNRAFGWHGEVNASRTQLSQVFTGALATFGNPSTELGLDMRNSADTVVIQQETGQLDWIFHHPAGITNVSYSGKKYTTLSWPSIVGLQKLQGDVSWATVQNEDAPSIIESWQTFSRSVSLGGTYNMVRFAMDGSLSTTAADMAMVQFDTVVLTIASANLPVISMGGEQNVNYFDFTLTNNMSGEYIQVSAPCPVNTTLVVDCENKLSYLSSGERIGVRYSTDREPWLDLLHASSNQFQFDDTGTVAVTVVIEHKDRNM